MKLLKQMLTFSNEKCYGGKQKQETKSENVYSFWTIALSTIVDVLLQKNF